MAKNIALIPGEKSNWEVVFFLLIDEMVPFLKPQKNFNRQSIINKAGMSFLGNLLGSIGYEVNKTLENSLQSRINIVVKKGYLLSDFGNYTLTQKGYERLSEIRSKFSFGKKEPIGKLKESMDFIDASSDKRYEQILSSISPEALKKLNIENLSPKEAFRTLIKRGYNVNS